MMLAPYILLQGLATLVVTQTPPPGYNNPDASVLAARVQSYYEKTTDFKAKFKQTYTKAHHGAETPRYGYVWVKKPGLMRWDYSSPRQKQLVCDGVKIWIYDAGYKQVFWQDLKESAVPTAISFLWGRGKIVDEFFYQLVVRSKYQSAGVKVLKLLPRQPNSNFKHVLFVVDLKTGLVRESVVYDHLGNKNHYAFTNTEANTQVPVTTFKFTPPAGVRVIKATQDVQP